MVLLAVLTICWWPGDVSWLTDEPRLLATAWHANHSGQLALGGLYGNFGIRYGPLPTQIYQLLLLLTHDPITLVVCRTLLCAGVTGFALVWTARVLSLPAWLAAGVLISPHVAAYQRVLWDASFAMPLGALALAGLMSFLKTHRSAPLRLAVVSSALLPTIHPQSLPLAGAILGWLAWHHRADLWQDRRALAVAGALVLALNGYYLGQAIGQLGARFGGSWPAGYPGGGSHFQSALAPLVAGRLLCGADYLPSLARSSAPLWLRSIALGGAILIYPLGWVGIGAAVGGAGRWVRTRAYADAVPIRTAACAILLIGLLGQSILFGALRIPAAPQYFFGTFSLHVLAAMFGVDVLRRWRVGALVGAVYVLGAAGLMLEAAVSIHRYGFERSGWPTLSESVAATRLLNHVENPAVFTNVPIYQRAPQTLRTLRLLMPPPPTADLREGVRLLICKAPQVPDGPREIVVKELPAGVSAPIDAYPIDVTPMPQGWVPDRTTW